MKAWFSEFKSCCKKRIEGEKGQGIVEYALVLAFVVVIATAITTSTDLADKVREPFANMVTAFEWWGG